MALGTPVYNISIIALGVMFGGVGLMVIDNIIGLFFGEATSDDQEGDE